MFTAEWCITMNDVPSCTPSVQGAVLLPIMCTAPWQWVRYISYSLCTHPGKSGYALYTRFMIRNDSHGKAPLGDEHSATNGSFVHRLWVL